MNYFGSKDIQKDKIAFLKGRRFQCIYISTLHFLGIIPYITTNMESSKPPIGRLNETNLIHQFKIIT